jgi:hypothetical protein
MNALEINGKTDFQQRNGRHEEEADGNFREEKCNIQDFKMNCLLCI